MKANGKSRMKIRTEIRTVVKVAGILWVGSVLGSAVASGSDAPYEVGQYWEYTHEGPRPGAAEPNAIDGRRILQVLDKVAADADGRWVIEERFTNDPNIISRLHVGGDRMLTATVIENEKKESLTLTYDSPIPYQYVEMDVGGRMQLETGLLTQPGGFTLPIAIAITRLDDETIETPAGRFADCRHYSSVTDSVFDVKIAKIAVKEHRQWWYSDEVGATVKEIYSKDPVKSWVWSKDGYTSTSTLAAFGVRGVSDEAQAAAIHDVNVIATALANRPTHRNYKAILAIVACVAAGGVILARRRMRAKNA